MIPELIDWMVRSSCLLLGTWMMATLLQRWSATVAHRMWVAAMILVAALPALQWLAPSWVGVSLSWRHHAENSMADSSRATESPASDPSSLSKTRRNEFLEQLAANFEIESQELQSSLTTSRDQTTAASHTLDPVDNQTTAGSKQKQSQAYESWQSRFSIQHCLFYGWLIVTGVLVVRLTLALLSLRNLVCRTAPATTALKAMFEQCAAQLNVGTRFELRIASMGFMPSAFWLGRWYVVVPKDLESWPLSPQRTSVLHELGHVARKDAWADLTVQFLWRFMWFSPLTILATREVQRLRERACDEWVVARSELDGLSYAYGLVDAVSRAVDSPPALASAMCRSKDFSTRLKLLARRQTPNFLQSQPCSLISIVALGLLAFGIATARIVQAQLPEGLDPTLASGDASQPPVAIRLQAPVSLATAPGTPAISLHGIVRDAAGKPLPGIQLLVREKSEPHSPMKVDDVLAVTDSDREGRFEFSNVTIPPKFVETINSLRAGEGQLELIAWGRGCAVNWQMIHSFDNAAEVSIQMQPQKQVVGVVCDEANRPIPHTLLQVVAIFEKVTHWDDFTSPSTLQFLHSNLMFRVQSDDQGRFEIPFVPNGYSLILRDESFGQIMDLDFVTTADIPDKTIRVDDTLTKPLLRSPLELRRKTVGATSLQVQDNNGELLTAGKLQIVNNEQRFVGLVDVNPLGETQLRIEQTGLLNVRYLTPSKGQVSFSKVLQFTPQDRLQTHVLRAPATVWVAGQVRDIDTQAPIGGATVNYLEWSGDLDEVSDHTGATSTCVSAADGSFRLPALVGKGLLSWGRPMDGYYTPWAHEPDQAQKLRVSMEIEVGEQGNSGIEVQLSRGLVIRGKVLNETGELQRHTLVRIENLEQSSPVVNVITDDSGSFEAAGLSPSSDVLLKVGNEHGMAQHVVRGDPNHPLGNTRWKTVVLIVKPSVTLTGRVIHDGQPAAGTRIVLRKSVPETGIDRYHFFSETWSDASGWYSVPGLNSNELFYLEIHGNGDLQAKDWKYQTPYVQRVEQTAGELQLPDAMLLHFSQRVAGQVVDPEGQPVSGVSVIANYADGARLALPQKGPPPWTKTDAHGRFTLTNLPEESIELMVYRSNSNGGRIAYSIKRVPKLYESDIRIEYDPRLENAVDSNPAPALRYPGLLPD